MSYIYLQEQGEESSVESYQDIPQSVLSRLNLTHEKSCCKDSETECCQNFQSGTISEHSTERLGEEKLTLSPEDFLAKTFPQLEKELESRANEADSWERWPGWLAKYDQDLSLWKTPQYSLLEDYIEFSETWPKWGIMRDGAFWELTMSVRHIEGKESGYWHIPTPTCADAYTSNLKSTQQKPDTMHSVSLAQLCEKMPEMMWPTPAANEDAAGTPDGKMQWMLTQAAKSGCKRRSDYFKQKQSYPTPGTTDMSNGTGNCEKANKLHESGQISEEERRSMRAGNGGQLNPDWVEWLMGWPIAWTQLEPIELDWRDWTVDPADDGEISRVSTDIQNRVHRLKAIGNGQVPLVAATAWSILSEGLI